MKDHSLFSRVFSGIFLYFCLSLSIVHADGVSDTSVRDTSVRDTSTSDTSVSDLISRGESSGAKVENEASTLIDSLRSNASEEFASAAKVVGSLGNGPGNGGISSNQGVASSSAKTPPSASPRKYPKQKVLKDIQLPHKGKGKCRDNTSEGSGKCPSSLLQGLEAKQPLNFFSDTQLFIFVSQSVPASSMKELWNQAQSVGGKLLFRGLVGGSFKETQNYIEELGIVADIDPTKFDEFEIIHVPTFILSIGDKHDKMVGNVSLNTFLEQASQSGDLLGEASNLYKKIDTCVKTRVSTKGTDHEF